METQVYDHPDDPNVCCFMHMQNNDRTNFWALSTGALTKCLELQSYREFESYLGSYRHRTRPIYVANYFAGAEAGIV